MLNYCLTVCSLLLKHQEVTQITLDAGNRVNAMVPLQAALSAAALPVNPNVSNTISKQYNMKAADIVFLLLQPAYNPAVLYQYGQLLVGEVSTLVPMILSRTDLTDLATSSDIV